MKKIKNRQIITLTDFKSDYFSEAVFILKDNVICKDDTLFSEAVEIAAKIAEKIEKKRKRPLSLFFLILFSVSAFLLVLYKIIV